MTVETFTRKADSRGDAHIIDITSEILDCVAEAGVTNGTVSLFVPGSTAGLTTVEQTHDDRPDHGRSARAEHAGNGQRLLGSMVGSEDGHRTRGPVRCVGSGGDVRGSAIAWSGALFGAGGHRRVRSISLLGTDV